MKILDELIERAPNGGKLVRCLCACGEEFVTRKSYIDSGHTKSCGCIKRKRSDLEKTPPPKLPEPPIEKSKESIKRDPSEERKLRNERIRRIARDENKSVSEIIDELGGIQEVRNMSPEKIEEKILNKERKLT
jgi:hypothetical protein